MYKCCWLVVCSVLAACGGGDDDVFDPRFESPGPYPVGNATIEVTDADRGRTLTVEIWYPADESARAAADAGEPVGAFVVDATDRTDYEALLAAAPAGCPSTQTQSARDASLSSDESSWPLLVFSHCHNCVRFSSFSIAERLASHGFVVAAADHAGNTLFDDLADMGVELGSEFLQVRREDVSFVLDVLLDGTAAEIPADLRGALDAERVGVYGHSFGAVTTGLVLQDDPRPRAGFALASPMENPLLEGVLIADIVDPVAFLVAVEDNSITEVGNLFIRRNFDDAPVPAWKAEVSDAGHWSVSDICGVHEQFMPGCGDDERQTDGTDFTYLPVSTGIGIAAAYVTAFFAAELLDDGGGRGYLAEARPSELVTVEQRNR
jgi:dienelactone hydrolase